MHIYQEERNLQDENRALDIPGGFQVEKNIAMSSAQLSQVRNSFKYQPGLKIWLYISCWAIFEQLFRFGATFSPSSNFFFFE